LLRQAPLRRGASHYGEIVQQAAEQLAERMVQAGLKRLKWREKDLPRRRKGDMGKVKLAYQLRAKHHALSLDSGAIADGQPGLSHLAALPPWQELQRQIVS